MKYFRLKKRKDISKVLKTGKRAYSSTLMIVYLPSDKTKLAVCVGKKYGKSVQRNRIKRLLRESFMVYTEKLNFPCAFLFIPKEAEEYSYSAYVRDVGTILKREKLIDA